MLTHGMPINLVDKIGWTPLNSASNKGYLDVVKELLAHGASIDMASNNGWTPLNNAASKGHLDVVKELLAHGASIDVANDDGWTPLNTASSNGHLDVVKELLAHGASIDVASNNGWTPLKSASSTGLLDIVKELVARGASIDVPSDDGWTPLNIASSTGHLDVVKELLAHGASIDVPSNDGWTILNNASSTGHLDVVKELLAHGASIDVPSNDGWTPLNSASNNGHLDVVKELLAHGASIDVANNDGLTPLNSASNKGYLDVVKELLAHRASIDVASKNNWTPVNNAASKGHFDVVKELLAHGASIDVPSKNGWTPLSSASSTGHLDIVKALLARGASIDLASKDGWTPLNSASSTGHLDVVKELLAHGASIDMPSNDGWTPLNNASSTGHLCVVKELLAHGASIDMPSNNDWTPLNSASNNGYLDVVKELLAHGASIDVANNDGLTPLNSASNNGHLDVVKELLARGASIDVASNNSWTPVNNAASKGHIGVVKELLAHGASIDMPSNNGWTPLNTASSNGHLDVVKELLDYGASIDVANNDGWTPLISASRHGNIDILRVLLNAGADFEGNHAIRQSARDYGNDEVQAFLDNFPPPEIYSIALATEFICHAIEEFKTTTSDIAAQGTAIMRLSLKVQIHRQRILTTGLMVKDVLRQVVRQNSLRDLPTLLATLKEIRNFFQMPLLTTHSWNFCLPAQTIAAIGANIARLQDALVQSAKSLKINFRILALGKIDDMRRVLGKMMENVEKIDESLKIVSEMSEERQLDRLVEFAIQLQRGLDHYQGHVKLGNFQRNVKFEHQVVSCQYKICNAINEVNQARNISRAFGLHKIESWMLSSEDIEFDPNDIEKALGRGGFATVFKGTYYGQLVAVKRFHQHLETDSADLEKLISKEIKAWKDISDEPFILSLVGVCTKIPRPILVSELCQTNIRRYVRDRPETLIPMMYQFACGLACIHNANIIHRDLKGDNVLVTYRNTVAIADFGLSRSATSLKNTNIKPTGTLNWMSPEQYFIPRTVTMKSDVWSFGMTLWEILCNETPFRICSEDEFRNSIFQTEDDRPEKPDDLEPQFEPLWTLITTCWQLNPVARPSAEEILDFFKTHYSSQIIEL
ncbi:hypothetical protein AC1031_014543 [Aphanomyces cochlioides]|nr:hypothetical protein AC1031_014543 [Aphanomyces cochlioides]